MAKLGDTMPGFVPVPPPAPPKPKPKKEPQPYVDLTCHHCGFETPFTHNKAKKWYRPDDSNDKIRYCPGCATFFGMARADPFGGHGYTPDDPDEVNRKIAEAAESKYILITKSGCFGGSKTGITVEVDFGDIFPVARVGSTAGTEKGESHGTFLASTVDIKMGPEMLTLYTHEFMPISWLDIMALRKDGIVIERFLDADCPGYFAPTPEGKKLLTDNFGDR